MQKIASPRLAVAKANELGFVISSVINTTIINDKNIEKIDFIKLSILRLGITRIIKTLRKQ